MQCCLRLVRAVVIDVSRFEGCLRSLSDSGSRCSLDVSKILEQDLEVVLGNLRYVLTVSVLVVQVLSDRGQDDHTLYGLTQFLRSQVYQHSSRQAAVSQTRVRTLQHFQVVRTIS